MMNVARSAVAVLLLMLPLVGCNNDDLPPATSFASLHGTVVDAISHQPVPNATVIVDTVLSQTTDAQGTFSFAKVPSGIVDYVVKAAGYPDVTASGNAVPGKPFEITVGMSRPTPP